MGPIRYGGYRPPRESFVRLKVGGEDEDGVDDGNDGEVMVVILLLRLSHQLHKSIVSKIP